MSTFEIKTGNVVSETLNRLIEQEVIVTVNSRGCNLNHSDTAITIHGKLCKTDQYADKYRVVINQNNYAYFELNSVSCIALCNFIPTIVLKSISVKFDEFELNTGIEIHDPCVISISTQSSNVSSTKVKNSKTNRSKKATRVKSKNKVNRT